MELLCSSLTREGRTAVIVLKRREIAPLRCYLSGVLSAKSKLAYDLAIPADVLVSQVSEQAPSLSHQLEKAPAGGVILVVRAEVIGQTPNALGEDCYLNLSGTGVARRSLKPLDNGLFCFGTEHPSSTTPFLASHYTWAYRERQLAGPAQRLRRADFGYTRWPGGVGSESTKGS